MVLGEDWLEQCSPMWMDWAKKILRFTRNGQRITLAGLDPSVNSCASICSIQLQGLLKRGAKAQCLQFKSIQTDTQLGIDTVHTIAVSDKLQLPDGVQRLLD